MFKSILVPVDIAHRSSWQFALPQAIELAKGAGGTVTVMTVVRDIASVLAGAHMGFQIDQMLAQAETALSRIAADHRTDGVALGHRVQAGSIGHEVLKTAGELGCDLIVMASHRPEMRDYLIGSNAAHVVLHAPISVLVVRRFA